MMLRGRISIFMVFLLLAGVAGNSSASLTPGTYDLLAELGNGSWMELYAGGGPGKAGNVISAISAIGGNWSLLGVLQTVVASSNPAWTYQTTYAIGDDPATAAIEFGFALAKSGTWGETIEVLKATATNYSKYDDSGKLAWYLTFTAFDKDNPLIPIVFEAAFDGAATGATYTQAETFHGGSPFTKLTMTVTPIPGAVWLLAPGVVALAVIRRRTRRN